MRPNEGHRLLIMLTLAFVGSTVSGCGNVGGGGGDAGRPPGESGGGDGLPDGGGDADGAAEPDANFPDVAGLNFVGVIDTPVNESIIGHPDLAGISLRFSWGALEPREGVIDTTLLKAEVARVEAAGKRILLRVFPGKKTPEWLYAKGVPSIRYKDAMASSGATADSLRIPVPWNEVYLAAWSSFVTRLGGALAGDSAIVLVHMTGANSASGELGLAQRAAPTDTTAEYIDAQSIVVATGTVEDLWIKHAGYSLENLRKAWAVFRDAWARAFPKAMLSYNIVNQVLQKDGIDNEIDLIVEEAFIKYPQRLVLQNNAFNDSGSIDRKLGSRAYQIIKAYSSKLPTGFQSGIPHGQCSVGTTSGDLGPSLAVGINLYGADYFELWEQEISKYPLVLKECNDRLLDRGSSCGTAGPLLCHLDTNSPVISITSPQNGATVSGEVALTATATDNVLVFGVQFKVDGVDIGPEQIVSYPAASGFSAKLNTKVLSEGPHQLTAAARDVSGNTTTSAMVSVIVGP